MADHPPLPHPVAVLMRRYQAALAASGIGGVSGIYLLGSLALGDFREGESDVDFITLIDCPLDRAPGCPLDAAALQALATLHRSLSTARGPALNGCYLETDRLARVPGLREAAPFTVAGGFHSDQPCADVNPATFQCLARSGIAVAGPPPVALTIAQDAAALRQHQIATLNGAWTRWLRQSEAALARMDHDADLAAAPLAWGTLGILRIACTLETGRIVSKTAAGRWALEAYPTRRRSVIEEALAVRWGAAPMHTRARAATILAFLRDVVAETAQSNLSSATQTKAKTLD